MRKPTPTPAPSAPDARRLLRWVAAFGTPQQVALRCRIVLAAAEGRSDNGIADRMGINRKTVALWRSRFAHEGPDSLWNIAPGRGRKPTYGPRKVRAIVTATLRGKPNGASRWSCRLMAASQGVSKSTVSNIWRSRGLEPHRAKAARKRAR